MKSENVLFPNKSYLHNYKKTPINEKGPAI